MRNSLGAWLFVLSAGCAHTVEKAREPAPEASGSAEALSQRAEEAYEALDFPACTQRFLQAAEAGPDDARAESLYRAAGCASLAGDASQAMALLKRSVQHGYSDVDHLRFNRELTPLHALPGWEEARAGAQANHEKAPSPSMPVPVLTGIDVAESRRADAVSVRRLLGVEVGQPIVPSGALTRQAEKQLRERYDLAFAKVSLSFYLAGPNEGRAFLIVDLVDAEDAHRLRFLPEPSGHPRDPEGLVARWRAYEARAFQLMQEGKLDLEKGSGCRVAHCVLGFDHPELAPFEPEFLAKVPPSQDALVKVLREDADAENRAAAAFLLAYAATPEQSVERLVPSIRDPSSSVRNNVLRVLTATQEEADHPLLEAAVVVDALALPEFSDRNKSLYLLQMLLEDQKPEALKAQAAPLVRQLGRRLVALTSSQAPNIREPAVAVLQRLTGKSLGSPEQWKAWLAEQKD